MKRIVQAVRFCSFIGDDDEEEDDRGAADTSCDT